MKISYAIRKGMKNRPQCTGKLIKSDGSCCALGALALGAGFKPSELRPNIGVYILLGQKFPVLNNYVHNPTNGIKSKLMNVIYTLNDNAKWSRRKISDWLQKLGY